MCDVRNEPDARNPRKHEDRPHIRQSLADCRMARVVNYIERVDFGFVPRLDPTYFR
jgi:hypothetical protein